MMLLFSIFWLSLLHLVDCGKYDDLLKDLITTPWPDAETEFRETTRNFKNHTDEFIKKIIPLSELFGKCIHQGCSEEERKVLTKLTDYMSPKRERIYQPRPMNNLPSYLQLDLAYENNVNVPMKLLTTSFESYKMDYSNTTAKDEFIKECSNVSLIAEFIHHFKGWKCMNTTLSPKAASAIFELIEQIKFKSYRLSPEEESVFNVYFAALYFYLADRDIDISDYKLKMFIAREKKFAYDNKLYLLLEIIGFYGIDLQKASMSDCLPMTAFIQNYFSRTVLMEERNAIAQHVHTLKNLSLECSNLSSSKDSSGAEKLVSAVEEKTSFVEPFLSEWFESLLESTWPETETDLIRGFVKESANSGDVPWDLLPDGEFSEEYQRIANEVHDKMKSIGNPGYVRQYVITKDPKEPHPSRDFENQCKWYSCSRGTSTDVQFVVLRTLNDQKMINESLKSLETFTKNITPTVLAVMEMKYKSEKYLPRLVQRLYTDEEINLRQFGNHSSFIGIRSRRYRKNCKVAYGMKAEKELGHGSIQKIHYHNDGGLLSMCNDWVFLLGV